MAERPSTMERQFKINLEQQDNATKNCLTQNIDDKKHESSSSKNPSGSLKTKLSGAKKSLSRPKSKLKLAVHKNQALKDY